VTQLARDVVRILGGEGGGRWSEVSSVIEYPQRNVGLVLKKNYISDEDSNYRIARQLS
jgi:hypothetical protein